MPNVELQKRVEERVRRAYSPPPNFKRIPYTKQDAATINIRLRTLYLSLSERRDLLAEKGVNSFLKEAVPAMQKWLKLLASEKYSQLLVDHATYLYDSGRTKISTDAEVRAYMREQMKEDTAASATIDDILAQSYLEAQPDFEKSAETLLALQLLFDFQAAEGLQNTFKHLSDLSTILYATKATSTTLSAADWFAVNVIFGKQFPEVLDSIMNRRNLITAVNVTNAEFENLRNTIKHELYEKMEGGAGGRAIARQLQKDMIQAYGNKFEQVTKERYLLWGRTEGASIQNDALMRIGSKANMDGKIWQDVGDALVRDGSKGPGDHISNGAQGVIPTGDSFADGSVDGGMGSVSPWNCRCVVGPALLEQNNLDPNIV